MINTDAYLALGLAVISVILGGYVFSLYVRLSNVRQQIAVIEQLKGE